MELLSSRRQAITTRTLSYRKAAQKREEEGEKKPNWYRHTPVVYTSASIAAARCLSTVAPALLVKLPRGAQQLNCIHISLRRLWRAIFECIHPPSFIQWRLLLTSLPSSSHPLRSHKTNNFPTFHPFEIE